jgi:DNA-binding response OmpR family regulator
MSWNTKQALIVEDDKDVTEELKSLLGSIGFKVTTLEDPLKVAEALGTHQYEVALLNKRLPQMSWRSTFSTVKSASRSTTIIMISHSADEEDIRTALSAGSYVVLNRPVSEQQLTHLLSPKNDGMFVALRG